MTSEGQHAGQQPAGATSGGGAEPYGTDGFPPGSGGPRHPHRPPASFPPPLAGSYPPPEGPQEPDSYAPPPHATPNGGSPFVVPAVPGFGQDPGAAQQPPQDAPPDRQFPEGPPNRHGPAAAPDRGATHFGGSARVPTSDDDSGALPQRSGGRPDDDSDALSQRSPTGSARVSGPQGGSLPQRGSASVYGVAPDSGDSPFGAHPARPGAQYGGASSHGSASVPQQGSPSDDNGWAARPPAAGQPPGRAAGARSFTDEDDPHPYSSGGPLGGPSADYERHVSGSPTRDSAGHEPDAQEQTGLTRAARDQTSPGLASPDQTGPDRSGPHQTSPAQTGPDQTRPDRTGPDQSGDGHPRLSAFGDQRVRIPGATLAGLPDSPPPAGAAREDSGALPRRTPSSDPHEPFGPAGTAPMFTPPPSRAAQQARPTYQGPDDAQSPTRSQTAFDAFGPSSMFGVRPGTYGPPSRSDDPASGGPSFGRPTSGARSGAPTSGPLGGPASDARSDAPPSEPFGGSGASPFGQPTSGLFGGPASGSGPDDRGGGPFGRQPFGAGPEAAASRDAAADHGGENGPAIQAHPVSGPPGQDRPGQGGPGGFVRRIPGASFAGNASPVAAPEVRNDAVPQPRDPAEHPATGSARPVAASASVPMASRVTPPAEVNELPPQPRGPQARVYGRATPPGAGQATPPDAGQASPDDDQPESDGGWPWDDQRHNDSRRQSPEPPAPTPQSPARAAGRASASARVAPPAPAAPDDPHGGPPYTEFTTDVSGRSRTTPPPPAPDYYGEHTTDISGRGDQSYAPATLPSTHPAPAPSGIEGDRPRMGAVFPGRATVTPPVGPDGASSWPNRPEPGDDQRGFDQVKPKSAITTTAPAKPETTHVRMLPILIGVVIAAVLLVGLAFGLVYLISGESKGGGFSVSAGECVKQNGTEAVKANCGEEGAFEVVTIADTREQCDDPRQPYVLNPTKDGKTQVLCLKPRG